MNHNDATLAQGCASAAALGVVVAATVAAVKLVQYLADLIP